MKNSKRYQKETQSHFKAALRQHRLDQSVLWAERQLLFALRSSVLSFHWSGLEAIATPSARKSSNLLNTPLRLGPGGRPMGRDGQTMGEHSSVGSGIAHDLEVGLSWSLPSRRPPVRQSVPDSLRRACQLRAMSGVLSLIAEATRGSCTASGACAPIRQRER